MEMKAYIVQPYYSFKQADIRSCFDKMLGLADEIGEDADIIVLPEYCDIPAACDNKESFHAAIEKYNTVIKEFAEKTARRCQAIVFFNAADNTPTGPRNTTYVLDRKGNLAGKYYKAHPAPSEVKTEKQGGNEMDVAYSYSFSEPCVIEVEGVRFGFMTCYDFYFYESFAPLALKNVDVIIGCSHQRTDTHEALSIINRFLCYNTNAYLVRASVSLGVDSKICGCSSIIAPNGDVLVDMKSSIGIASAVIDTSKKYYKPAGFRGSPKAHYEYIEEGRRPWLYRNGGPGVVAFDKYMPYPRFCAHRGCGRLAPKNTMPSFGTAVALGADEIELTLSLSKDGVPVVTDDLSLQEACGVEGRVCDYTLSLLKGFDFGSHFSNEYKALPLPTLEEVLQKFAGRIIINVNIQALKGVASEEAFVKIAGLVKTYDCDRHLYFTADDPTLLIRIRELLPFSACCIAAVDGNDSALQAALQYGFDKVQLSQSFSYNKAMLEHCRANGIRCSLAICNDSADAQKLFDIGIDCILTDDFYRLKSNLQ